jgi:Cys-tRNA(Pro) deacylase
MKVPVTAAVRFLRSKGVDFEPHIFDYVEKGGTGHSAEAMGVDEHSVIKTLIFETSEGKPVAVLMHGDREVSEKNLARRLGVKSAAPASSDKAGRWTGYVFGGTSPFGLRTKMPILVEATVFDLDKIYINGGKRGFLVAIDPEALAKALEVEKVNLAI